ncbi:MAG: hypothetical protein EB127_08395 [Alphaproteobacteria bacterium]|nr:hypothetical protein [Alphaproteobacteria bacterium]
MASSNTVLRVAELDFDDIKVNLRNFLRSQSQFSDYDFEGSGLNILLDILAYNTHYMSYYLNMIGNEMFLDSATNRNSIVSHAKHLNYVPNSLRGATAIIDLEVVDDIGSSYSSFTLPAHTKFMSQQIDGVNYSFITMDSYTTTKNVVTQTFTFSNVYLLQGDYITYNVSVDSTNTKRRFTIPSSNVDTSTLVVTVQNSSLDSTLSTYSLADDTTQLTGNSKVYFLEEGDNGRYTIYFGDDYIGKNLIDGNVLKISYLDTDGQLANKANLFTLMDSVGSFPTITIIPKTAAYGGSDRDTNDKIKFLAPKFYTTQNRAVTKDDYGTLLLKDYPNVQTISVWGGEENDPVVYGKIFVSMKPKTGYVITEYEKDRIVNELIANRSILTVIPEIIDPDYLYFKFDVTVNYDSTLTSLDEASLKQVVKTTISNYNNTDLGNFNSTFRTSKLQNQIDSSEKSFLGSDLNIVAQKRIEPYLNETKNYTIDFNIPLLRGSYKDKLYSYPTFQVYDNQGITRDALIEETPLSYTGVDSIQVLNSGSGYTDSPTITITGDGTGATAKATVVNGKIVSIQVVNTGSDYTAAVVTISDSTGSGATATPTLSGQVATLRTYYIQSTTGEKIIINGNAGRINYSTGRINLYNFKPLSISTNPNYSSGVLTINVIPEEKTIHPLRNRLLTIDPEDPIAIQVTMENEA